MSWRDAAACRGHDPDIFLPSRGESIEPARSICATCSVFDPCWELGLTQRYGVFAGTSERERRRLRRKLGIRLAEPEDIDDHDEPDDPMKDTA